MPPNQPWEYIVVHLNSPALRGGVRVFAINDEVQPGWDRTPSVHLHELLNAWGADGWELVNISPEQVLVFKRVVQERVVQESPTEARTTRLPGYTGP